MNKEIAGEPAYSKEYRDLMKRLEYRDAAKQMSDVELHSLRTAIDDEMIRREVVRHIQTLANELK